MPGCEARPPGLPESPRPAELDITWLDVTGVERGGAPWWCGPVRLLKQGQVFDPPGLIGWITATVHELLDIDAWLTRLDGVVDLVTVALEAAGTDEPGYQGTAGGGALFVLEVPDLLARERRLQRVADQLVPQVVAALAETGARLGAGAPARATRRTDPAAPETGRMCRLSEQLAPGDGVLVLWPVTTAHRAPMQELRAALGAEPQQRKGFAVSRLTVADPRPVPALAPYDFTAIDVPLTVAQLLAGPNVQLLLATRGSRLPDTTDAVARLAAAAGRVTATGRLASRSAGRDRDVFWLALDWARTGPWPRPMQPEPAEPTAGGPDPAVRIDPSWADTVEPPAPPPRRDGSGAGPARPQTIAIDPDEHHARHVGTTADGRQFFLTAPHLPGTPGTDGAGFLALYLFDAGGTLLDAQVHRVDGLDDEVDAPANELLAHLGARTRSRIVVRPFTVERHGLPFGLIAREAFGNWVVSAEPGNYMAWHAPWDSGTYDT